MFPIGFDEVPCHISSNLNCFRHGSPLRHQTRKITRGSRILAVFYSPDLKMQPKFLCHLS